jgi:hypothetical protein
MLLLHGDFVYVFCEEEEGYRPALLKIIQNVSVLDVNHMLVMKGVGGYRENAANVVTLRHWVVGG